MPPKQKQTKQAKNNNAPRPKNARRRNRMRMSMPTPNTHVNKLLHMINHPCDSDLEPGLHGTSEGVLQRFVTNFTSASGAPYGYVVWFPSLHTGVANGDYPGLSPVPCSSFIWNDTADGNTVPFNTTGSPFGSGGAGTASSIRDPFFTTSSSVNVQDGRTLAACIKIRSTSPISSIQGTIAYLDNIPADLFDLNTTGSVNSPPTVNQMLAYSRKIERLGIDSYEVKHRPSDADRFYTDTDGVTSFRLNSVVTTTTNLGDAVAPRGIGFVWTNTAGASSFLLSLYKVVEWRPSPLAGVPVPRPISSPDTPRVSVLTGLLDKLGEWQHSREGQAATNNIVNAAWTAGQAIYYSASRNRFPRLMDA